MLCSYTHIIYKLYIYINYIYIYIYIYIIYILYIYIIYQDSLVVSREAKKQHAYAQPTWLPVIFTGTNAVKFPSFVTRSSCTLPLSYYRASTFLPCRISKPKMNELGCTVMNQPFRLLWCPFPCLRLKLDRLEHN